MNCFEPMPIPSLDDLMAEIDKLGPPSRLSIRIHPLSQGLLRERLKALFPDGFNVPADVPIVESEFIPRDIAVVKKEVYSVQKDEHGFLREGWYCEEVTLIKLTEEEDELDQYSS